MNYVWNMICDRNIYKQKLRTMRKYFIALVAVLASLGCSAAEVEDIPVEAKALPAAAQHFLKSHFPNSEIVYALKDVELADVEYKVALSNGVVIEFDKKGVWKDIDGHGKALPESVIPAHVLKSVRQSFPGRVITDISIDRSHYEVKLDNGLEVEMTSSGRIVEVDD